METFFGSEDFLFFVSQGFIIFLFLLICFVCTVYKYEKSIKENIDSFFHRNEVSNENIEVRDEVTTTTWQTNEIANGSIQQRTQKDKETKGSAEFTEVLHAIYSIVIGVIVAIRFGNSSDSSKGEGANLSKSFKSIFSLLVASILCVAVIFYLGVISRSISRDFVESKYLRESPAHVFFL